MKEFEIWFADLTPEAQQEYLKFIGVTEEMQGNMPITTIYIEEE